jgi:predicted transcriptional regulator
MKTLTESQIQRQNILNNAPALKKVEKYLDLGGSKWKGELIFTQAQVAEILGVDEKTIKRYISSHREELKQNGYRLVKGQELAELIKYFVRDINVPYKKVDLKRKFVNDMDVVHKKIRHLGLFTFRSVLNLAMLLTESEKAKAIRARILDIVIYFISSRTGGNTKYINQRDSDYLMSAFQEENYRKEFVTALDKYVEGKNKSKLFKYTNLIYQSIFKENAREYREILNLEQTDRTRDTMYSEVLTLIASYETGIADELKKTYNKKSKKLSEKEVDELFATFESHPLFKPLINDARAKMASRDLHFRDALHEKLEEYIKSVPQGDFEKFLGEKSKSLAKQIEETREVFKRLKNK